MIVSDGNSSPGTVFEADRFLITCTPEDHDNRKSSACGDAPHGADRLNTHTPPHGAFGTLPAGSGKNAKRRMRNDSRLSAAAVWRSEATSTGVHPSLLKKAGPSAGANVSCAPAWLRFF